jgi:hypothetical protein
LLVVRRRSLCVVLCCVVSTGRDIRLTTVQSKCEKNNEIEDRNVQTYIPIISPIQLPCLVVWSHHLRSPPPSTSIIDLPTDLQTFSARPARSRNVQNTSRKHRMGGWVVKHQKDRLMTLSKGRWSKAKAVPDPAARSSWASIESLSDSNSNMIGAPLSLIRV